MNSMTTFQNNTPAVAGGAAAEMMISRQAQEVQAAMVVAKRFPRDEGASMNRIIQACTRLSLAESAMYEYPRGGENVTGPSIRLAEVMAQNWGNLDFGITELEQKNGESTVMAYCWDLETNTRQTKIFTVPHVRATKKGSYALTDPRDIYEIVANQGARRLRACILGIIPGDVVDAAVAQCETTLMAEKDLKSRVSRTIEAFKNDFGVPVQCLEQVIGCKAEAFTVQAVVRLGKIYNSIKEGRSDVNAHFNMSAVASLDAPRAENIPDGKRDANVPGVDPGARQLGENGKQVSMSDL